MFSTKFLDDLAYKPEPLPNTKKKKIPVPVQINERPAKPAEPNRLLNKKQVSTINEALAIEIAESIYEREVEMLIRELAQSTFKEELVKKLKYQKPIYESIYEPILAKMVCEIVHEVVDDYERKIKILQSHAIKKVAREQIVSNLMLDHMLDSVAQQGKSDNDNDDVVKLLDSKDMRFNYVINQPNEEFQMIS